MESKAVDDRLQEIEQVLEDYSKSTGLDKVKYHNDVEKILELTLDNLRNTTEEERGLYSFAITRYAIFIQKENNRHKSKQKWAQNNLNVIVAKHYTNYKDTYASGPIKEAMVINDNAAAKALNKIVIESNLRIEELDFLANRIQSLAETLKELQKSSRATKYDRG